MRLSFLLFASSFPGASGFIGTSQSKPNARIVLLKNERKSASCRANTIQPWRQPASSLSSSKLQSTRSPSTSPKRKSTSTSKSKSANTNKRSWTYSATTITGKWRENLEDLKVYEAKHGHTRVPYNYAPNQRLGRWVARQRSLYNEMQLQKSQKSSSSFSGTSTTSTSATRSSNMRPSTVLTQERIDALNDIGFSFESPRKRTWNKRFDDLCTYKALHGDCLVPLHYDAIPGLGIWVRNQRTLYRNIVLGRKKQSGNYILSPERISALQSVGFVWDTQRNDAWKKRFDELVDFKAVYGHCSVPEKYHENPSLGAWVVNQRTSYKNFISGGTGGNVNSSGSGSVNGNGDDKIRNSTVSMSQWRANGGKSLTPEKIKALESIGFCWDQNQKNWYSMYERLKQYKAERKQQMGIVSEGKSTKRRRGNNNADDNTDADDNVDDNVDVIATNNALFHIAPEDVANRDLRLWISVQRKEYSNYMQNKNNSSNNNGIKGGYSNTDTQKYTHTRAHTHAYSQKRTSMTPRRKRALDDIEFPWSLNSRQTYGNGDGPTVDDWTALFEQMREKGIDKDARPKEHWFEGQSLLAGQEDYDEKEYFSDDDLLELWNMEDED